ncbi:extracellular solute-binding protein [Bosea sp. (in: a-proteobacteria)]|uniref:extracellular solute-binding protein n=1 Tax=Bosea sp. (in: a-proteobacteria) TaxID=1871050 RepID=UPI001AC33C6B|nr:extracellular solute-binding protein [Bosea sp. (in: a-proteobacteria)]MBN9442405.1 ABC transporter substrate-binding protein [Bosea sp. (in: a-proteobacteria)]
MAMRITRRRLIEAAGVTAASAALPGLPGAALAEATESHGLSTFGELALPPDFPHFSYVNPKAPKGGTLTLQIKQASGNQSFDTFNTLNIWVLQGDGAAGMDACFDSLMAGSGDEPGSLYGLLAKSVAISSDKLTYRFRMRPEAKFHDGSRVTAKDVAFSLNTLKTKGHPSYRLILGELVSATAEGDDIAVVQLSPKRSRDLHLIVASLPVLSEKYWSTRDFTASTLEPPLGSGAYKVGRFEQGRFIEFERVADYWAKDLPVNVGTNNFDRVRWEYFRDRQVAFEGFKSGVITFQEEFTSRIWATGYDFPALKEGKVKKESLPRTEPVASQGWIYNLRREKFADPRIREALGLAFDFEWTRKTIMFGFYERLTSYFENSDSKAVGKPSPEELALLEPWRGKVPDEVFGEPWLPPVSDGSGSDRALLRKADEMLRAAGCKRDGNVLKLPNGQPFEIEFLDSNPALQPHTQPFQANLKRLGINATSRFVDPAQYQRRLDEFDFDIITRALSGSAIPSDTLRVVYGSEAAKTRGSRNQNGISEPAIDAMIEKIGQARSYAEAVTAAKCLDRLLRAGRYWIPMWWNDQVWIAHWDMFDRPQTKPKYGSGAPGTWWYDAEKAKRIGKA